MIHSISTYTTTLLDGFKRREKSIGVSMRSRDHEMRCASSPRWRCLRHMPGLEESCGACPVSQTRELHPCIQEPGHLHSPE